MRNVHTLDNLRSDGFSQRKGPVQNFLDFFFPGFNTTSINFYFIVLQILGFVATFVLSETILRTQDYPWRCAMFILGAKYTPSIVGTLQVWRFFTPVLLHQNLWHLFWNVLAFCMLGFRTEQSCRDHKHFIGFLIVSAFFGNAFSAAFSYQNLGVGSSTVVFGMLGIITVYVILNFKKMIQSKNPLFILTLVMLTLILFQGFILGEAAGIDQYGHLGGFVGGVLLFPTVYNSSSLVKFKLASQIALVGLAVYLLVTIFENGHSCSSTNSCKVC